MKLGRRIKSHVQNLSEAVVDEWHDQQDEEDEVAADELHSELEDLLTKTVIDFMKAKQ